MDAIKLLGSLMGNRSPAAAGNSNKHHKAAAWLVSWAA